MKKLLLLSSLFLLLMPLAPICQYVDWQELAAPPVRGSSFAIDKANNYFYMGSYQDGLYRSTDKGTTWQKVYDQPNEKSFYAVAVRADGAVFAGGIGTVYRSTDNGATWSKLLVPQAPATAISQIAFGASNEIYLGTQNLPVAPYIWPSLEAGAGIFKSTDNGANWTALNTGLENTSKAIGALLVAPSNNLFAAVQDGNTRETGGVFHLGSGATSWQKKPMVIQHTGYTRTITPTQVFDMVMGDLGELYVTAEGLSAASGIPARAAAKVLLTSTDAGTTWHEAHIVANPGNYTTEPVPEALFAAGTNSWATATILGHHPGTASEATGLFAQPFNGNWQQVQGGGFHTTRNVYFAEDGQGAVYALEDYHKRLFRTATISSSPEEMSLSSARLFPNPTTSTATVSFSLPAPAHVQLLVQDLLGRSVAQVVNSKLPSGQHQFFWNPKARQAGTYLVKLVINGKTKVHKVQVLH